MAFQSGTSLVGKLETLVKHQPAVQQTIEWRPSAWRSHFPEHKELINHLAGNPATEKAAIKRSSIYESAKRAIGAQQQGIGAHQAFITIMIWGRGLDNRGPALTKRMTKMKDFDSTLADIIRRSSAPECTHADAFLSLFERGRPRIRGLGVSFGTKLIHAFSDGQSESPALVYDDLVKRALRALRKSGVDGVPDAPSPWRFMKAREYADYCEWSAEHASKWDVKPRDVEFALFLLGRSVKTEG